MRDRRLMLRKGQLLPRVPWTPLFDATLAAWFDGRDVSDGSVASWVSRDLSAHTLTESTNPPTASSSVVAFDGTNDILSRATPAAGVSTGKLVESYNLPEGQGSAPGAGFVCTGLVRAPDGSWWFGNDGRTDQSDETFEPSLVHMSADFSTKLAELDMSDIEGIESIQGVAYDTSDDTLWFCDKTNNLVRHCTTVGVLLEDDIAFTGPNGVAYHEAQDALWIINDTGSALSLHACDDGTEISTRNYDAQLEADVDMLFYDNSNDIIWISGGGSGSAGFVRAFWPGKDYPGNVYRFADADAIEGIWFEASTNKLYIANDGLFHGQTPAVNRVLEYQIQPPYASVIDIWGVWRVPTVATPTDCIISHADPTAGRGWAVLLPSTTTYNISANSGTSGSTERAQLVTDSATISDYHVFYAKMDWTNETLQVWMNGTSIGSGAASQLTETLAMTGGSLRIGSRASGTALFADVDIKALGWNVGAGSRQKIEGYLAHAFALTGALPSDHPYKGTAP